MAKGSVGVLVSAWLVACAPGNSSSSTLGPQESLEERSSTQPMDWDGAHPQSSQWTQWTAQAIVREAPELIEQRPRDVLSFCPNYDQLGQLQKMEFWIFLLSAMARYESGFNPQLSFQENFKDSSGQYVISRGLLQLSHESVLGYQCPVTQAEQLHDPEVNLSCSVRILRHWLIRDGVIAGGSPGAWRGSARYWAVLRRFANSNPLGRIQNRTRNSQHCQ